MDAALAQLRALDPRARIGAAAAIGLLAVAAVACSPAPTAVASASPTAEPPATPARVRSTPVGTAAPRPATFVAIEKSIPVSPPPAPRSSPTREAGTWRLGG